MAQKSGLTGWIVGLFTNGKSNQDCECSVEIEEVDSDEKGKCD